MTSNKIQNSKPVKKSSPPQFDPNRHLYWSTTRIIAVVVTCSLFSLVLVFGFLLVAQYHKPSIEEPKDDQPAVKLNSNNRYTNQNWGISFNYPDGWSKVIGSFEDGEYYFSSEPINFINEIGPEDGILALKTYNNWNNLPYEAWLKDQQDRFWPKGQLTKPQSQTIANATAQRFQLRLNQPVNNTNIWDIVVISRTQATKYVFIMQSNNEQTEQKFLPFLESTLSSIEFSKVNSAY